MPKLVRNKPQAPLAEGDGWEPDPTEQRSVKSLEEPNSVRRGLEGDRILFDETTDSTEQASETLPRGTKAVLKAPVNETERRPFDDYPTEPGWTQALLDREKFSGHVVEPAAGAGWMVQTLQENGYDVVYSDLERDGVDFLAQDFADRFTTGMVDNVVTNPPYKFLDQFAAKALELARFKVALLLPDFALVGVNRTRDLWQAHPPKKLILVTSKMKVLGKVSMFPHVWAVWDKEHEGPTTWEWATVPKEQRLDTSKAEPNLKESTK